jgi:microcystin-dependent protein
MSEPFVGEIRMFAGNFAPRGWALCDGQLLAVSQNDALFSLLGTIYGGDGRTTFGLPEMRGRVPVHIGQGPGLSNRSIGARAGSENETLTVNQMPQHAHGMVGSTDYAGTDDPIGALPATAAGENLYNAAPSTVAMDPRTTSRSGGGLPMTNVMPFLCVNFIIALIGIYPSRT